LDNTFYNPISQDRDLSDQQQTNHPIKRWPSTCSDQQQTSHPIKRWPSTCDQQTSTRPTTGYAEWVLSEMMSWNKNGVISVGHFLTIKQCKSDISINEKINNEIMMIADTCKFLSTLTICYINLYFYFQNLLNGHYITLRPLNLIINICITENVWRLVRDHIWNTTFHQGQIGLHQVRTH